jgi:hypothetical protein
MENDFALHGHMQISPRSSLFGKNQPFLTGLPVFVLRSLVPCEGRSSKWSTVIASQRLTDSDRTNGIILISALVGCCMSVGR